MNSILLISLTVIYFAALFAIASYANRDRGLLKRLISPSTVYALSLAVYCTAWTFFGSVGNASKTGIGFLPVYLGPTALMPIIAMIWLKMIRICREHRITNIADLMSSRYGNSLTLGIIITLFYILGIIPYIAIQLKAISNSIAILSEIPPSNQSILADSAFYISLTLIVFTILYGTRNIDASEKRKGLVMVLAFESIVKILAFLAVGIFVSFFVFSSPADIFTKFQQAINDGVLTNPLGNGINPFSWLLIMIVSALAMVLLPRQFQVAVVENTDEAHVKRATWLLPLYLLVINIFVLPIALGGLLFFKGNLDADTYVLAFPINQGAWGLSLFVFFGGIAAATGMVIMETLALTNMLSNSIIIPVLVTRDRLLQRHEQRLARIVLFSRRFGIVLIIFFAYLFDKLVAERATLVSIGLVSFAAVAQVAPALLGGLYWSKATRPAAIASILIGASLWFYTLIIPNLEGVSPFLDSIIQNGLFGLAWLKPTALFYFKDLDVISHGIFWSLLPNTLAFIAVSLHTQRSDIEILQAEAFVNIYKSSSAISKQLVREVSVRDIKRLLEMFLGKTRSEALLTGYANRHKLSLEDGSLADVKIVNFGERLLAGAIGTSSARMMMSTVANNEQVTFNNVIDIVKESQQVMNLNKELRKKSSELTKATEDLQQVNEQLTRLDELKDEFLYTVTHELRTPLTSIRALSEILQDNPDMDEEQKAKYLDVVVKETERMTHLISQVLNLERFESGRQRLNLTPFDAQVLVIEVMDSLQALVYDSPIKIRLIKAEGNTLVRGDRDLIWQVVYNLLSNAIKYAKSEIVVHLQLNYDELQICILDDGIGIAEEHLPFIFDKFYQIKSRKLQKPQGSGLGLAICKRILEMHDKNIQVENIPNKGAKFCFSLQLI